MGRHRQPAAAADDGAPPPQTARLLRRLHGRCVIPADVVPPLRTLRRLRGRCVTPRERCVIPGEVALSPQTLRYLPGSCVISRDVASSPGTLRHLRGRRAAVGSGGASSPEVGASSAEAAHPSQRRPASREIAAPPATTGRPLQTTSRLCRRRRISADGGLSLRRRAHRQRRLARRRAGCDNFPKECRVFSCGERVLSASSGPSGRRPDTGRDRLTAADPSLPGRPPRHSRWRSASPGTTA